jgi:hypothetical protein
MKTKILLPGIILFICSSCVSQWLMVNDDIRNKNKGNVGVGTSIPEAKLTVLDTTTTPIRDYKGFSSTIYSPAYAAAVYGHIANKRSSGNYAGYFKAEGSSSGVFGVALDSGSGGYGGVFHSYSSHGAGVLGLAANSSVETNYGGYFDARGDRGVGVYATGGENGYAAVFNGTTRTMTLEIFGGADVSEYLPLRCTGDAMPVAGSIVSIDPEDPGYLMVSSHALDKKVVGVISGAGNLDPGMVLGAFDGLGNGELPVALSGRVYCLAEATRVQINPGDFLTTSAIPGYAMKVTDFESAQGAIIGKAMSSLKSGKGLVLVLVSLQ